MIKISSLKTLSTKALLFSLITMLFACCKSNEDITPYNKVYQVSVNASKVQCTANNTKISLGQNNSLYWNKQDKLAMFATSASNASASSILTINTIDAGLAAAKFYGNISISDTPDNCFFCYPENTTFSYSSQQVIANFSFAGQSGELKPFLRSDAIAYNSNINCSLKHVGGVIKLTFPAGSFSSVSLKGNNNEPLSSYNYNFTSNQYSANEGASNNISIAIDNNSTECFICVPPVNFSKGFCLVFSNAAGETMYKSFNASQGYDFLANSGSILNININNFTEFTLSANASYSHLFNSSNNLYGSKVSLTSVNLQGAPKAIVENWGAELYNLSGDLVKSLTINDANIIANVSSSNEVAFSGTEYLPKGNYTLKPYVTIAGNKLYGNNSSINVAAPSLNVNSSAKTSYDYYLSQDITQANNCDGSTIYIQSGSINIDPSLLQTMSVSGNYYIDDNEVGSISFNGNNLTASNIASQSWSAHKFKAQITFDGTSYYSEQDNVCVTGLPYRAAPPTENNWTNASWNVSFNSDNVQLGAVKGSGEASITLTTPFYIPNNINCNVNTNCFLKSYKFAFSYHTTFTISYNGSNCFSKTSSNTNGQNEYLSGDLTFVSNVSTTNLKCNSSYTAAGPYVKIYTLNIIYR